MTRVQMDLPSGAMERLRHLKEANEATSYAEVIKEAIKLYEFLFLEEEKGSEFLVRDKQGQMTRIKLFV